MESFIDKKEDVQMNEKRNNRIGGRDLINIGIFTAIIAIIMMAVMPIGFIPILMPFYCVFIPLIGGIPWMLFVTKTKKFGMILIMSILLSIILMLTGMGWYALPVSIISGLIAELIVRKSNYTSAKMDIIACGFFSIWVFGSFVPLIFMADAYWKNASSYGEDFVNTAKSIFQVYMAPVLIICCIVFGMLGGFIGTKIMKKHFVKAGIV